MHSAGATSFTLCSTIYCPVSEVRTKGCVCGLFDCSTCGSSLGIDSTGTGTFGWVCVNHCVQLSSAVLRVSMWCVCDASCSYNKICLDELVDSFGSCFFCRCLKSTSIGWSVRWWRTRFHEEYLVWYSSRHSCIHVSVQSVNDSNVRINLCCSIVAGVENTGRASSPGFCHVHFHMRPPLATFPVKRCFLNEKYSVSSTNTI